MIVETGAISGTSCRHFLPKKKPSGTAWASYHHPVNGLDPLSHSKSISTVSSNSHRRPLGRENTHPPQLRFCISLQTNGHTFENPPITLPSSSYFLFFIFLSRVSLLLSWRPGSEPRTKKKTWWWRSRPRRRPD